MLSHGDTGAGTTLSHLLQVAWMMFLICCNIFIKLSFHRISAKFLFGASEAAAAIFRQNVSECTNGCLNIPDAVGLGASHRCPPRHPQVPVGRASQAPQPLPSHSGELWAELRPTPGWNEPDLGTRHCRMNAWVAWPWPPPHHISSAAAAWTARGPSTLQGHMLLRMWTFLDVEGNVNAKCWKLLKKYLGEISGTVSLWCLAASAWVMRNPPTPLLLWGKGGSYGSEHAENGNLRDKHKAAHGVAATWYGPETFIAPRICRTENHFTAKQMWKKTWYHQIQ